MDKYEGRTKEDIFISELINEAREILQKVGSPTPPRILIESIVKELQALGPKDSREEPRSEEEIWNQIRRQIVRAAYATRPYCIRCGTCCASGSPTLVEQDIELFFKGVLKPEHVETLRQGEMTYSSITEETAPLEQEAIKIKERPDTKTCVFLDEKERACLIYEFRPAQCRGQECWNPDNSQGIEDLPKLTRKPLLEPTGVLWEIIERHEERCSHDELRRVIARLASTKGQTVEQVLDMLRYDQHVREFAAEHFNLAPGTLDFFFGRSLRETVHLYGLVVKDQPDGTFLLTTTEAAVTSHETPDHQSL
ncbi:MAG: YkgJ family cysteine cluster protein [Thermodesulfobacteriota bacterium]